MNAIRRSLRLTMMDRSHWEVSAVDTEFWPDGRQQRSLGFVHCVPTGDILRVAHRLVEEHVNQEMERYRKAHLEAAERE